MKILKIKIVVLLFVTTLYSCNMDINVNPNEVATTSADQLLPAALLRAATLDNTDIGFLGGFWGGQWGKAYDVAGSAAGATTSTLDQVSGYAITNKFAANIWEDSYLNLYNLSLIENQEGFNASPAYIGIAKIMKGHQYLRLVDFYNNIPFSEALDPTNHAPKYDQGEEVYKGAIAMLTAGINAIKQGGGLPGADDILFGGNMVSWIKLGNSLKLRALIRMSEVAQQDYIREQMDIIRQEGSGFLTADALMNPGFTTAASAQLNPFWSTYYRNFNGAVTNLNQGVRPTRYLLSFYEERHDPRLDQLYNMVNGHYAGVVLGQLTADPTQNYGVTSSFKGPLDGNNQPAGLFKSATQPLVFFSAAESYFLQAEAAQRGWLNTGAAADFYQQAIAASFDYLGVAKEELQPYLEQVNVRFDNSIEKIIEQKWLALNGIDGAEAWNDYRRLGFPDVPASAAVSVGVRPYRLLYPESEVNANPEEVNKQQVTSGTNYNTRVFWQP